MLKRFEFHDNENGDSVVFGESKMPGIFFILVGDCRVYLTKEDASDIRDILGYSSYKPYIEFQPKKEPEKEPEVSEPLAGFTDDKITPRELILAQIADDIIER